MEDDKLYAISVDKYELPLDHTMYHDSHVDCTTWVWRIFCVGLVLTILGVVGYGFYKLS